MNLSRTYCKYASTNLSDPEGSHYDENMEI